MLKRVLALTLSLLLIIAMLPLATSAATTEEEAMKTQIKTVYRQVQRKLGIWNLSGLCGLMTDYQLYFLGVDKTLKISDGNGQYNEYCNLDMTANGYPITAYPAAQYSLEEALYTMSEGGTKNVYNILVGFQWTNTQAGARYGHACVIHAILNGKVYFVEGFWTPMGGAAGNPVVCTIAEFAKYYDSWTRFEGAIEFGRKDYEDFCQYYPANLFIQTAQDTQIIAQLNDADNAEASIRTVYAGERLHVTALYKDTLGRYYYRVKDSGHVGYIPAENTEVIQFKTDDISLTGLAAPEALKLKKDFSMSGKVTSTESVFNCLEVLITDEAGKIVQSGKLDSQTRMNSLKKSAINSAVNFAKLPAGSYTYAVNVHVENNYISGGQLVTQNTAVNLHSSVFTVGGAAAGTVNPPATDPDAVKDGWKWENDNWYYYENGQARTGWFCDKGINYFLQDDGAAATGWAQINGKLRYFSDTGAMRTGWLETADGTYYLLSNGVPAEGWREIDGKSYYFNAAGHMSRDSWIIQGDDRYYVLEDGTRATGWVELKEGSKCFREDGRLYAEVRKEGNVQYIHIFEEMVGDIQSAAQADRPQQEMPA